MTTDNLGLFKGIYAKMGFLEQRQKVIAQNIANANTPDYRPQDVEEPSFAKILGRTTSRLPMDGGVASVNTTNSNHIEKGRGSMASSNNEVKPRDQKETYEVSPSGNAVILEEQMLQASETLGEHRMMANLHEKYTNMMRAATGKNR